MSTLRDIAVRHQVYLERLKAAEGKDYNKLLKIIDQQIAAALARLDTPVQLLTRGKLNALVRELKRAQDDVLAKAQDRLLRRLETIADYEAGFEARALTTATPAGYTFDSAKKGAAWDAAITTPMSVTGDLLVPFLKEMTAREVAAVNKVIMRGWSEGWTNDQITKILRGTKALNFADGLLPRLGRHNRTLVNTALQHTAQASRAETWAANDDIIESYRWVSTLDSHTTVQCQALDGKVFKVGKGPLPPIHMNCRSTTIAVLMGKLAFLSEGRTRASADGPVDGSLTYYEWLKQQDDEFQDSVLGAKRAQLFRDGGLSTERFAALQLGRNFEPLTLEQMQKLEPLAFRRAKVG